MALNLLTEKHRISMLENNHIYRALLNQDFGGFRMESPAKKAIVIAIDGASMELVLNQVKWGNMPNVKSLLERGVSARLDFEWKKPLIQMADYLAPHATSLIQLAAQLLERQS